MTDDEVNSAELTQDDQTETPNQSRDELEQVKARLAELEDLLGAKEKEIVSRDIRSLWELRKTSKHFMSVLCELLENVRILSYLNTYEDPERICGRF